MFFFKLREKVSESLDTKAFMNVSGVYLERSTISLD